MSKRKHKAKRDTNIDPRRRQQQQPQQQQHQQQQQQYSGPFGINPSQLLSMFGNIDMNQINNMLQNMGRDGIDFNNLNLGMFQNLMGNNGGRAENLNNFADSNEPMTNDIEEVTDEILKSNRKFEVDVSDENMQLLKSIRNIVSPEKVPFVDKIIDMYSKGAFKD